MTISKKALGITAAVLLAGLIGAYFAFLSPKATSVKLTVANISMASTQQQTVSGTVSPVEAGRLIIVEVKGGGPWTEVARTTTDATGVYKAKFPMAEKGAQKVRVRVEKDGRQKAVTSASTQVTVLTPTQVEANIPKFARTDQPLRITGRLAPAAARVVIVEKSTDGQTWTTASEGNSTKATGKFSVAAKDFVAGTVQLRVRIEASASEAEAVSKAHKVSVEDYKAAGRRYLQIVEPANKLITKYNDTESLSGTKSIAKQLSAAYTLEAKLFRQYAYWPKEVKAQIELLAKSSILRADFFSQVARIDSFSDLYGLDYDDPKGADNAPAFVRAALGLPKRA